MTFQPFDNGGKKALRSKPGKPKLSQKRNFMALWGKVVENISEIGGEKNITYIYIYLLWVQESIDATSHERVCLQHESWRCKISCWVFEPVNLCAEKMFCRVLSGESKTPMINMVNPDWDTFTSTVTFWDQPVPFFLGWQWCCLGQTTGTHLGQQFLHSRISTWVGLALGFIDDIPVFVRGAHSPLSLALSSCFGGEILFNQKRYRGINQQKWYVNH